MDKWLHLSIRSFLWYDGGADEKECKNEIIEGNEKVAQRKVFTKKQKYYKIVMAYANKNNYTSSHCNGRYGKETIGNCFQ